MNAVATSEQDIKRRTGIAGGVMQRLNSIWKSRKLACQRRSKCRSQGRRKVEKSEEARSMVSAGARAYSGGLGACPRWGPGG